MISTITAREAQMLFDRFIKNAVPVPSKFNVIDPFCEDKFSNRWEMFKDEHITAGSEEEAPSHFWRFRYDHMHLYNSCLKGAVENDCVSFTINVPYSSDQKFLELFLLIDMEANTDVTKDASGNVIATKDNLFELEFVKVSVLHAWKSYGRWVHYFDLSLFLLTLALTSYTNYTFYKNNSASEIAVVVVELILISYFTLRWLLLHGPKSKEIWSKRSRSHLLMYISESRIWIELAWFSLTFAGCIERLMNQSETGTSAAVMSVATMFQYGMMMFYFRPYKSFGHFVGMIERIVWDIRYYMCILAIIVYGYSQALFLVSTTVVPNSADDFTSIESSFVKPQYAASEAIVYLVGNPTIPPVNTGNPPVSTFLACMLTVTGNIILLNLLVAIMNNTYQKIQLHSEAEWLKQLCVTLTEQKHYFGYNPDKYIHYLRRKVDVEHERQMNFKEFDRDKKIAGDVIKDVKKSSDGVQVKLAKLEGMNTTMFELQTRLQSAQMTIHEQASNSLAQAQASHTVLSNAYTELQTVHADCSQISSALDELQAAHTYLQEMYCQLKAACETA